MKAYKEQLLTRLHQSGWKLVGQEEGADWSVDEYWKIRSIKQNWGLEAFVYFLVDPMDERENKIWDIRATYQEIDGWLDRDSTFATLDMVKGRFDEKSRQFVTEVNRYRDELLSFPRLEKEGVNKF
ncbi:hypothetical protein [Pleionea sp. CnH1-48]|uniref:hypothetical protein n=1 Tax=Pleionea sp. CnH1-48 TaxID=2954494 RepID=UPI0020981852|nr:hypothetical protein [Pleionea sp. CnH1-48]MCO7223283.1 hypothetical protein [Pleionea sp. CnH1-48]